MAITVEPSCICLTMHVDEANGSMQWKKNGSRVSFTDLKKKKTESSLYCLESETKEI